MLLAVLFEISIQRQNQRLLISMAFNFSPHSRAATVSIPLQTNDVFARAAASPATRRFAMELPFAELSKAGLLACALTAGLVASTPGSARAESKPATSKTALTKSRPGKAAATTKKTIPQTCVAKTSSAVSIVSRPRVSPIGSLHPVTVSSRHAAAENAKVKVTDSAVAFNVNESSAVVEALPAAPMAPHAAIRLAAAPVVSPPLVAVLPTASQTEAPAEIVVAKSNTDEIVSQPAAPNETIAPAIQTETGEPLTGTIDYDAASSKQAGSTPAAETTPVVSTDHAPTAAAPVPSRLYAPSISYEGGTVIARGTPEDPVRLESPGARIIAQNVRLDTVAKTVSAQGTVRVERQVSAKRFTAFGEGQREKKSPTEIITETLQGENFEYNYETRQGQLGTTKLRLANFNISAESLVINGQKYVAHNVIVRPGGLSDEELKIYGTPPLNLRVRDFTVDFSKPAVTGADVSDTGKDDNASVSLSGRTYAKGGALYFKNTRILPVPSAFLSRNLGTREEATYQITPRISTNSADGILLTTKFYFPLARKNPDRLSLAADVGLSAKIGFRGGVELESSNSFGNFGLGARINDIVDNQLTNRIELDRLPELQYRPPVLGLFSLPGGRRAGLKFGFIAGDYRERFSDGTKEKRSSRLQSLVRFTTRLDRKDGPYLDLFARASQYSAHPENLRTAGFEVGYIGPLTRRLNGQFSYSATSVSGSTPFRFDKIEIQKELRATFDILLTPRFIVPIDLRYDVDRRELRDTTFGILRNYKTFAYGVTYQSSRKEIKIEIRQGF